MKRKAWLVTFFLCVACAPAPDENSVTVVSSPDRQAFVAHVSEFLERRCGTLDCHGRVERPLRLYGQYGLRQPNRDAGPGETPTTEDERRENFANVIALEPEQLNRVIAKLADPETLLLVQKPLAYAPTEYTQGVRHKGGPQIARGRGLGYECLTSWLRGKTDEQECKKAAAISEAY